MNDGTDGCRTSPVNEGGGPADRLNSGAGAGCSSTAQKGLPASYLIVHNVSKRHNIGTLVRSAVAFGVTEVSLGGVLQLLEVHLLHFSPLPTHHGTCRSAWWGPGISTLLAAMDQQNT